MWNGAATPPDCGDLMSLSVNEKDLSNVKELYKDLFLLFRHNLFPLTLSHTHVHG